MTPEQLADLCARAYSHMAPWSAQAFADTLALPYSQLTATDHAFVLGQIIAGEAEILALAADPDHQRQGHATLTLLKFHADAQNQGADRIFLEVASRNAPARRFYEHHGYTEVGRRKAYYPQADGPADDAVVMTRPLP